MTYAPGNDRRTHRDDCLRATAPAEKPSLSVDQVMNTNIEKLECPVCGGTMRPLASVQNKSRKSKRFRCTCGHFKDLEEAFSPYRKGAESALPEGFQEFASESVDNVAG